MAMVLVSALSACGDDSDDDAASATAAPVEQTGAERSEDEQGSLFGDEDGSLFGDDGAEQGDQARGGSAIEAGGRLGLGEGTITLDGQVFELEVEYCALDPSELHQSDRDDGVLLAVDGSIAGHGFGEFQIDRYEDPFAGVQDRVIVEIGDDLYWETAPPDLYAEWLFLEIEGRRVSGTAPFEKIDWDTGTSEMLVGSIDVTC